MALRAFQALGKIGQPAVPGFVKLLQDKGPEARLAGVKGLRLIKGQATVAPLLSVLADRELSVRRAAAGALTTLDEASSPLDPRLVAALGDLDARVRAGAALAIGNLVGTKAGPASKSLAAMLRDRNDYVRGCATYAPGNIGTEAGFASAEIGELLECEDTFPRERALEALQAFGPKAAPAVPALIRALRRERSRAEVEDVLWVLKRIGPGAGEAAPLVFEVWEKAQRELKGKALTRHSDFALGALAGIGAKAVPHLSRACRTSNEELRSSAIYALGKVGLPALPVFRSLLKDEDPHVRREALRVLWTCGRVGDLRFALLPDLLEALDDIDSRARFFACWAIRRLRAPALPALVQTLTTGSPTASAGAASSISRIATGVLLTVPSLIRAANPSSDWRLASPVRYAVSEARKAPPEAWPRAWVAALELELADRAPPRELLPAYEVVVGKGSLLAADACWRQVEILAGEARVTSLRAELERHAKLFPNRYREARKSALKDPGAFIRQIRGTSPRDPKLEKRLAAGKFEAAISLMEGSGTDFLVLDRQKGEPLQWKRVRGVVVIASNRRDLSRLEPREWTRAEVRENPDLAWLSLTTLRVEVEDPQEKHALSRSLENWLSFAVAFTGAGKARRPAPFEYRSQNVSVGTALGLILGSHGLTWTQGLKGIYLDIQEVAPSKVDRQPAKRPKKALVDPWVGRTVRSQVPQGIVKPR